MKTHATRIITITLIAVFIILALYSFGIFKTSRAVSVLNQNFDEFTYTGGLKNGLYDGSGTINFPDGAKYDGNFLSGRFNGGGVFNNSGMNFQGEFKDGQITGGTFTGNDGNTVTYEKSESISVLKSTWQYSGDLGAYGVNGKGKFTFADGCVYEGDFADGVAEGEGTYTDASGQIIYTGGFSAGKFNGQGKYYSPDGWTYEGGFTNGLFEGDGVYTNGTQTDRGVWEAGKQVKRYED